MTGAVERSTFSSGTDSKDSSFSERAGGGHKLRPGLTLRPKSRSVLQHWARSEGGSSSVSTDFALHPEGRFTTTTGQKWYEQKIYIYHVISRLFDLNLQFEHIANFWRQVCMACSLVTPLSGKLTNKKKASIVYSHCRDLPGRTTQGYHHHHRNKHIATIMTK